MTGDGVTISVVIPAHNAAATLQQQLDAVLAQQCKRGPFEVIVVNNNCSDDTASVVHRCAAQHRHVRIVDATSGAGPSYARNVGIAAARSSLIACCDADDIVGEGWLDAISQALTEHDVVAGVLEVEHLNTAELVKARGSSVPGSAGNFFGVTFAHGCNFGVRKATYESVGGLNESLRAGEEIDLAIRLRGIGVNVYEVREAVIHYRYRTTAREQWNQAFEGGRVKPHLCRLVSTANIASPSRIDGLRNWFWLVRNALRLRDRALRTRWRWVLASRCGQLAGCVRFRTVYI